MYNVVHLYNEWWLRGSKKKIAYLHSSVKDNYFKIQSGSKKETKRTNWIIKNNLLDLLSCLDSDWLT